MLFEAIVKGVIALISLSVRDAEVCDGPISGTTPGRTILSHFTDWQQMIQLGLPGL